MCAYIIYPHIVLDMQEMLECRDKLRCDPPNNYTYHDRVFANKMNHLIQLTDDHYEDTMYREALKTGFYDLQVRIIILIHGTIRCTWHMTTKLAALRITRIVTTAGTVTVVASWTCQSG